MKIAVCALAVATFAFTMTAPSAASGSYGVTMYNRTAHWALFLIITKTNRGNGRFCLRPKSEQSHRLTEPLRVVDVHAEQNENCVGPGIGREYVSTKNDAPESYVTFEGSLSNWRLRWGRP